MNQKSVPTPMGAMRSLAWCGEVTAENADDVWALTNKYVDEFAQAGTTLVIVDVKAIRFIDSSGAALMLRLKRSSQRTSAQIIFTNAGPVVKNVLRLAAVDNAILEGGG